MGSHTSGLPPLSESSPWPQYGFSPGSAAVIDPGAAEIIQMLATPEWQLAKRVASSKSLGKSELLPKFLLHVCELTLRGRAHELTEQRIGNLIFNRPSNYNPGEDNIVRSYARLLRKRLEEYFATVGRDEPLRIVVPRGGYVPLFLPAEPGSKQDDAQAAKHPVVEHQDEAVALPSILPHPEVIYRQVTTRSVWAYGAIGILIGILLSAGVWFKVNAVQAAHNRATAHVLWEQMFQPNRNTLIVPADAGLGIIQNLSGKQVNVEEYASGSYLSDFRAPPGLDAGNFNDLRRQRYTSVADLSITSKLSRLPEFIPNRTEVRYSRSLTAEDLKGSNIILLGSKHSNPWDELFEKRTNFRYEYTPTVDQSWIVNQSPSGTEQKIYRNGGNDTSSRTYGTISYLPGLDANTHVLIIQGLNMAATQAAAEILFDSDSIRPILKQATLANGQLRAFELLIETNSIGATAPGAQIVATRFGGK